MRPLARCWRPANLYFNPRTHVGCDIRGDMEKGKLHRFQSTHPRGVRRFAKMLGTGPRIFQSTHPRGVRRSAYLAEWSLSTISIHAPTWGATNSIRSLWVGFRDFNPRTHVGCDTKILVFLDCKLQNFNPRTHVGCDSRINYDLPYKLISIHAPTWGATVKPSNGWLLGHKDNEFANENIIIINSVNIT